MLNTLFIRDTDKILIIAPHPDDECIGCGGILSLWGNNCDVIVMTDGGKANINIPEDEMIKNRKKEFEDEMIFAGVNKYELLNYPDGELILYPKCMDDICFEEYDFIFLPSDEDNHSDHTAAFLYAKKAIGGKAQEHKVYKYEVHNPIQNPDYKLDITSVIEKKEKLIGFHLSQIKLVRHDKKAVALAKYRACSDGNLDGYLEVFKKVNTTEKNTKGDEDVVKDKKIVKNVAFVKLYAKWLEKYMCGWTIDNILKKNGWKTVSIYGFSDLGRTLYFELKKENVKVVDIFDNRSLEGPDSKILIKRMHEGNRSVDVIIVTAIGDFKEIKGNLLEDGYKNIISLNDVIEFEM